MLSEKDFNHLEQLNLSYNKLSSDSIRNLYVCKKLKQLDLAANNFESLPEDISGFNRHILFSEEY